MRETSHRDANIPGTIVTFQIVGSMKENSLELPGWSKSICISDTEMSQIQNKERLNAMKINNALAVFEQYYNETFNK